MPLNGPGTVELQSESLVLSVDYAATLTTLRGQYLSQINKDACSTKKKDISNNLFQNRVNNSFASAEQAVVQPGWRDIKWPYCCLQ